VPTAASPTSRLCSPSRHTAVASPNVFASTTFFFAARLNAVVCVFFFFFYCCRRTGG
jgi:hypothetical protein